ncbi:MAG: 4-hydroxythreonine-4-phosphate dehydrogenase PdxA [Sandaracinaceae bacterium]
MTRLAIATGDPAGVGPEVSVRALAALPASASAVLFGDGVDLRRRLAAAGISARVEVVDVGACPPEVVAAHRDDAASGRVALAALDGAIDAVRSKRADAIVTAPVSKGAITLAGHRFVGQTEHLARRAGLGDDDVTMMFLGPRLRVALVTTHLAVRALSAEITRPRIRRTIRHLAEALIALGAPRGARLVVCGLNPHAGEHGLFGDEEDVTISPVVQALAREDPFADGTLALEGPRPAEAAFRDAQAGRVFGVVAMFHDQATIASKLLDWGSAVNVSWGLPFPRTSVDHGVAYDAARSGCAEADGMIAAVELAVRLVRR